MKKSFLLATFPVVVTMLAGCDKETPENYNERKFAVKNATDKTIVVTGTSGTYWFNKITIAPGESKFVFEDWIPVSAYGYGSYGGYGDGYYDYPRMKDDLDPDFLIPYGNDSTVGLPEGETWLDMAVDGKAVPASVWLRKNWDFLSDFSRAIYTLTVTDALLSELSPEPEQ